MSIEERIQCAPGTGEPGTADAKNLGARLRLTVDAALREGRTDAMQLVAQLKAAALHTNFEPAFAILRRIKPILVVKDFALVTRYDDVQEVLSRDDVFLVTYGDKMKIVTDGSNFFLGMQDTPQYTRDVSNMRIVVRREDLAQLIAPKVQALAGKIVDEANGRLDVVPELTRRVPTLLITDYFGTETSDATALAEQASTLFRYLFIDLDGDPELDKAARAAAAEVRRFLDRSIARRKAAAIDRDDVLGRCMALQQAGAPGMDDLSIRNNLLGLIVGAIATTSKCCAQVLDQLLKRPAALAGAQAAAAADDDALLAKYVFEALRFNPNNPGVLRLAAQDYVVAEGTLRATRIPKGTTVLALTQSAMFDRLKIEHPYRFSTDRPEHAYMHFGYGLHSCFGRHLNQVEIPGILKPLLLHRSLKRAPGSAGSLQFDGPFPKSMCVRY